MEAVAHNPQFAAKVGIAQSVGQEFADADEAQAPKGSKHERLAKAMMKK